jgi:acetyltransferase-like isoleucine patch superfamily enzyme
MIAILGAGPHGHELADLYPCSILFDDNLSGYKVCLAGAELHPYLIGAAMPNVRRRLFDSLPGRSVAYQDGTVVFPKASVSKSAQLGEHVHIMYGAVVSHGCEVGDFVTIAANAVLNGEVVVESGAFIGSGAQIRHGGITIGRNAVVGMGAIVVEDVPEGAKVYGNPAKVRVPA